jgi:hypothetical protein
MTSILHIVDPKGCEEISQPFFRIRLWRCIAAGPEKTGDRKESNL